MEDTRNTMNGFTSADINPRDLTDGDLNRLLRKLMDERLQRAVEAGDPDTLASQAMQEMFGPTGDPSAPRVVSGGIVAVAGIVQDTTAGAHNCKLMTVKMPDSPTETWSWDEGCQTFLHGDSEKVGKLRRSVNLHLALDGLVLVQHSMAKRGDERHNRVSCRAWEVKVDVNQHGEVEATRIVSLSNWTPSHLPPPNGETDTRSYEGRASR